MRDKMNLSISSPASRLHEFNKLFSTILVRSSADISLCYMHMIMDAVPTYLILECCCCYDLIVPYFLSSDFQFL